MPISSYTVLSFLAHGGHDYEEIAVKNALSGFSLFAFVIHDPKTHSDFDQILNKRFDHLDFETGNQLLFFALVNDSSEWFQHGKKRKYYDFFRGKGFSHSASELLNPSNFPRSNDTTLSAFTFATSLGIPMDSLPCIVVTQDLRSSKFSWFSTSPNTFEEQLRELGYLAERKMPLKGKNLSEKEGSVKESIAKNLSEIFDFLVSTGSEEKWLQKKAFQQAKETLKKTLNQIQEERREFVFGNKIENSLSELERLSLKFILFLGNQPKRKFSTQYSSLIDLVDPEFFEKDSLVIFQTEEKVFRCLSSEQSSGSLSYFFFDDEISTQADFTPSVICIAKVFEKEMNFSTVQWIRKQLGITFPDFFCKPQNGIRALFSPSGKPFRIDFNKNAQGKWLPPGLGQSAMAFEELGKQAFFASEEGISSSFDSKNFQLLVRKWFEIKEVRNKAAHTMTISFSELLRIRSAMETLLKNNIFARTNFIKRKMRGEG